MRDGRTESTQLGYDAAAREYSERTSVRAAEATRFFERFLACLRPNSVVGDLGCGPGQDLVGLQATGHRPLGIDRSMSMLNLAGDGLVVVRADLRELPLAHGAVDALWSAAALLHVERSELNDTLAEWDRVVTPGGLLGFTTSIGNDEGWELVPAAPTRTPHVPRETERWFVHHEEAALHSGVVERGWLIVESSQRTSHRTWLQVIAQKPE